MEGDADKDLNKKDYSQENLDILLQWADQVKESENRKWVDPSKPKKWKLATSEVFGRYLEASSDIAEGEVIIVDKAVVTGPRREGSYLCLGCCVPISLEDAVECSKCCWWLCNKECETKGWHPLECASLAVPDCHPPVLKTNQDQENEELPLFEAILPLRMLLLREKEPLLWKIVMTLEAHDDARKDTELWQRAQEHTVIWAKEKLHFTEKQCDLLQTLTGILDINAFEMRKTTEDGQESSVRGIFPLAAMLAHDCTANTFHTVLNDDTMLIIASKSIKKGQSITANYTHLLSPTKVRRQHLRYAKLFDCNCNRCSDPTELGTYFSAFRCSASSCSNGLVVTANPLDYSCMWQCNSCKFQMKSINADKLNYIIHSDINKRISDSPLELELIMERYGPVLHSTNTHMISIKHELSRMYGRSSGYTLPELNESQIQTKISICIDIINLLEVISPGMSRLKGITMYELHAPIMFRAMGLVQQKGLKREEFIKIVKAVICLLQEAGRCLQFEPATSFEGQLYTAAIESAEQLKQQMESISQMPTTFFSSTPSPSVSPISPHLPAIFNITKKIVPFIGK